MRTSPKQSPRRGGWRRRGRRCDVMDLGSGRVVGDPGVSGQRHEDRGDDPARRSVSTRSLQPRDRRCRRHGDDHCNVQFQRTSEGHTGLSRPRRARPWDRPRSAVQLPAKATPRSGAATTTTETSRAGREETPSQATISRMTNASRPGSAWRVRQGSRAGSKEQLRQQLPVDQDTADKDHSRRRETIFADRRWTADRPPDHDRGGEECPAVGVDGQISRKISAGTQRRHGDCGGVRRRSTRSGRAGAAADGVRPWRSLLVRAG